ncbi:Uncharacterised protein [Vibrio cholerae]|nr:Uncharacterised protein [Vibrio cholerae]
MLVNEGSGQTPVGASLNRSHVVLGYAQDRARLLRFVPMKARNRQNPRHAPCHEPRKRPNHNWGWWRAFSDDPLNPA